MHNNNTKRRSLRFAIIAAALTLSACSSTKELQWAAYDYDAKDNSNLKICGIKASGTC